MPLDRLASAGLVAALAWNFAAACSSTSTNGSSSGGGSGATDASSGKGGSGGVSSGGGAPVGGQGNQGGVAGAGGLSPDDSGVGGDAFSEGGETCAACTQISCNAEYSACISDPICTQCTYGPSDAGCMGQPLFDDLVGCWCSACPAPCSTECSGGGD